MPKTEYSVESVSSKYLENGWSDQHGDFSVEFRHMAKKYLHRVFAFTLRHLVVKIFPENLCINKHTACNIISLFE